MNPLTVKIFDCNGLKHCFLDMCTTTGKHAGTAETVFSKMEEVLQEKFEIPWENCVALSVDNTNSNIGIHNSISTRLRAKNPNVYILGCPCHILHNDASEASAEFEKVICYLMLKVMFWQQGSPQAIQGWSSTTLEFVSSTLKFWTVFNKMIFINNYYKENDKLFCHLCKI